MRRCLLAVVILGFVALVQPANAAEPRVALVIGNSAYAVAPLTNPANDARLMAATLRNLGFEVMERIDADQKTMKYAIIEFGERLDQAGSDAVGLFFYAGHGLQVKGENFLVPLNAQIDNDSHVAIEAVSAFWVLGEMEFAGNRMNFVILDACRNNPLAEEMKRRMGATRAFAVGGRPAGRSVSVEDVLGFRVSAAHGDLSVAA